MVFNTCESVMMNSVALSNIVYWEIWSKWSLTFFFSALMVFNICFLTLTSLTDMFGGQLVLFMKTIMPLILIKKNCGQVPSVWKTCKWISYLYIFIFFYFLNEKLNFPTELFFLLFSKILLTKLIIYVNCFVHFTHYNEIT